MLLHNRLLRRPIFIRLCLLIIAATLSGGGLSRAQDPSTPPLQKIESDDQRISREGIWKAQSATAASGASYLYNTSEAVLSLNFSGPSLEIIYVAGPTLGTLAIEVDGTVLRTVITADSETRYGQSATIDYLTDEAHELKVYAQGGRVIGLDAFVVEQITEPNMTVLAGNHLADPHYIPCNPTHEVQLISRTPTGQISTLTSYRPLLSTDGQFITYLAEENYTDEFVDIMRYDRARCASQKVAEIQRYALQHFNGSETAIYPDSIFYDFSLDGRYITFSTRAQLSPQDTALCPYYPHPMSVPSFIPCIDLYRLDLVTGQFEFLTPNTSGTQLAAPDYEISGNSNPVYLMNGDRSADVQGATQSISQENLDAVTATPDGRYTVFESQSDEFVPNDTNGAYDVFRYDLQTETYLLVSVGLSVFSANSSSGTPFIADDGNIVTFHSHATNLILGDTNGVRDTYVRDITAGTTTRVSVASDGTQANDASYVNSISPDGRYITFLSAATNLIPNDTNGLVDFFVHDRQTHITTRRLEYIEGFHNGIFSRNGAIFVFETGYSGLVPGDTNQTTDIFLRVVGSLPDRLALWNPATGQVGLVNSQHTPPPTLNITTFSPGPPATGQAVMGDWDGDGTKSPGIYAASGVFYYTNQNTAAASWSAVWLGLVGRPPVAGRFDSNVNHDCIGAVDSANFPPYGTAFALYFTCDLTDNTAPALTFQWISVLLPDSGGFSGTHQFSAGDFDGDGMDSIAVRRGPFIAFTNDAPTTLAANFPLAQYFGAPATSDEGHLVVGDWDGSGTDSFGLFYQSGVFYWRDDLDWNSQNYFNQQVGQPIGPSAIQVTSWH